MRGLQWAGSLLVNSSGYGFDRFAELLMGKTAPTDASLCGSDLDRELSALGSVGSV